MAFVLQNFARQSVGFNTGETTVDSVIYGAPAIYTYRSASDSVATIAAANYFAGGVYQLSLGDLIWIKGSDAAGMYVIDAINRSAGTVTVASAGITGAVGTANIDSSAVTAVKLASDAVTTAKILANNVTSAKVALNMLQYATVTFSAAQFNGMYAVPRELVAAGGANTLIVLDKLQLLMTYVSANYASGGVVAVQYDSTANGAGVIASSTLAAATFQAAASTGFNMNAGVVAETFSTCVNKGLFLSNVTGAFTTGDSTFVAHVWYKIVATV